MSIKMILIIISLQVRDSCLKNLSSVAKAVGAVSFVSIDVMENDEDDCENHISLGAG